MRTLGVSPKLVAAVAAAIVSYLLTQSVLELPPGVVLALNALSVAVAAAVASPGDVVPDAPADGELGQAAPQTIFYWLAALIVFIVLVAILLKVLDRV